MFWNLCQLRIDYAWLSHCSGLGCEPKAHVIGLRRKPSWLNNGHDLGLVPTTPDAEQLRNVIRKLKGQDPQTPESKTKPTP
jgi:hypothetical protein